MMKSSKRAQLSSHSRRHNALNTQYLRAYRKKIESDQVAENIIQTTKFNLKLENAKLPSKKHKQLSLMDLINAVDSQS